jgi:hypothetical protein
LVLRHHYVGVAAGSSGAATDRFERRCLFFSTPEGHELFQRRIGERRTARSREWEIACDREVVGPWSEYATVWRVVIPALTTTFLTGDEKYFFW